MAGRQLRVELIGDADSLRKAFGSAADSGKGLGKSLGGLGKTAALVGGAAGIGALVVGLKAAISTSIEHQKAMAQTNAVIKSTGGVARVSGEDVASMADKIEKMSGMDDLAVQSGENMLLTFTNIRNEVGKGNDIFTQATSTLADMSTALGTDMPKQAIQLGKALNDPIKGVSALARVGVTFTTQQKEQIKTLVESGRTMDAQKLILRELGKEFGGSAKAAGETFAGKLAIAKARLDDVAQAIGDKLLPYLIDALNWLLKNGPAMAAAIGTAFEAVKSGVTVAVKWIKTLVDSPAIKAFVQVWKDIGAVLGDLFRGDWTKALEDSKKLLRDWLDYLKKVAIAVVEGLGKIAPYLFDALGGLWEKLFDAMGFGNMGSTMKAISNDLKQIFGGFVDIVAGILTGDWSRVWKGFVNVVGGTVAAIGDQLKLLAQLVWDLIDKAAALAARGAEALGKAIWNGIKTGIGDLARLFTDNVVTPVSNAATGFAGAVVDVAKAIGTGIITGIKNGITAGQTLITNAVTAIGGWIGGLASSSWDAVVGLGKALVGKIASGFTAAKDSITTAVTNIGGWIGNMASSSWDAVVGLGKALVGKIASGFSDGKDRITTTVTNIGGWIGSMAGNAWDAVVGLGRALMGKIASGFGAAKETLTNAVTNIGGWIGSMAGNAWGAVVNLGKNLVYRIADGIRSVPGAITGAISGIFSGLVGWVKDILGISSPSTVFMNIGHAIVDGLVKGLWNKAGDLKDAAIRLAKKIMYEWPWAKIKAFWKVASAVPADVWNDLVGLFGGDPDFQAWGKGRGGGGGGFGAATGALVTGPTLALIGEDGPEAVVPLTPTPGGPVYGSGIELAGGGGGVTVVLQNPILIGTGLEQAARELESHITRIQRQRAKFNTGRFGTF